MISQGPERSSFGNIDEVGDASSICPGNKYLQDITVMKDGGEVILKVFQRLKLITPSFHDMVVPHL